MNACSMVWIESKVTILLYISIVHESYVTRLCRGVPLCGLFPLWDRVGLNMPLWYFDIVPALN